MPDVAKDLRGEFIASEAVFSARAIAILLEGGILAQAPNARRAAKQLSALIADWEISAPFPKQPAEQADIDRVRRALKPLL